MFLKNRVTLSILAVFCFMCSPLVQAQTTEDSQPAKASLPLEELQMFAQVFGKIKSDYVESVDDRKILIDAINGILAGLDPHSSFLPPEEFREMQIDTQGQFGGVGIEVSLEGGILRVISPIDNTPAARAGIKAGDIILEIDGVSTHSENLNEAVGRMRGEIGSLIVLTIAREGEDTPLTFDIERDIIQLTSVRVKDLGEPGFAYMRISAFQDKTAQTLRQKIIDFKTKNDGIHGFILDLRNNPGGLLNGAIDVSDLFINQGIIVKTHGRIASAESEHMAKTPDLLDGAPMVVLVNAGSASASEIVAGALQDHQRAIILGTKTFGKGSVQTITPISNGSALKITTARYYTPSGRSIQETGIQPDILSTLTEQTSINQPDYKREVDLARHLANPNRKDAKNPSDKNSDQDSANKKEITSLLSKDSQLRDALNLLKGIHFARSQTLPKSG